MTMPKRGERGAVLAGVLCIAAAVLALAAAWFEMSTAQLRRATGFANRIRAFHAADAALEACAAMLATPAADASEPPASALEYASSIDVRHPFVHWPGVVEPPACHIEALASPNASVAHAYRITAHAGGMDGSPPLWLQLQISTASGVVTERRWRELAGQPR